MNQSSTLRYLGNTLLIIGYYILVWGDERSGLVVKLIGGMLIVPSFIYFKMWDSLVLCGFYTLIELSRLIHLFSGRG